MKNLETHFPLTTGPAPASAPGPVQFTAGVLVYSGRISFSFRHEQGMPSWGFTRDHTPERKQALLPKSNRMTHRPHGVKVEGKVVDGIQNLGQHLVRRKKVQQVGSRVAPAHAAAAVRVQRPLVPREA